MSNEFLNTLYTFEEQVVIKAYKNTIEAYKCDFEKQDINQVYKIFLITNNKKYSLGKYKALQIASFEYLYFSDKLKDVDIVKYELIDTPDDKQYYPPIYNKSLVVRNSVLLKKQKETFVKDS